jgi:Anti-sigma-K factor rskA
VETAQPPKRLREQLLKRFENEKAELLSRPVDRRFVRGVKSRRVWFWAPAFASAILAIAFATVWNQDRELLQMNRGLAAILEADDGAVQKARKLINTLAAEDAERVTLVAAGAKPRPEAKVVYSARQRSLVLLAGNLSPLPRRSIYELWLLPATGANPIPAGTFKPDARGAATLVLSQFEANVAAKGFAVTIEAEPGSSVPTMPIILSGGA